MTPAELREPFIAFDEDDLAAEGIKNKRIKLRETDKSGSGMRYNTNLSSITQEITRVRDSRDSQRNDCYSLLKDERRRNPFMAQALTSTEFAPESGVTHFERAGDANSPKVSGGEYRHSNRSVISRKEFELRKSLQNLKGFGPETYQISRSAIGRSLDVSRYATTNVEKVSGNLKAPSIAHSIQSEWKPRKK